MGILRAFVVGRTTPEAKPMLLRRAAEFSRVVKRFTSVRRPAAKEKAVRRRPDR
jgi:hypothetical protein